MVTEDIFVSAQPTMCKLPKIGKHVNRGGETHSRPPLALASLSVSALCSLSLLSVLDPSADLSQLNIPFLTRALKMVVKLEIQYW